MDPTKWADDLLNMAQEHGKEKEIDRKQVELMGKEEITAQTRKNVLEIKNLLVYIWAVDIRMMHDVKIGEPLDTKLVLAYMDDVKFHFSCATRSASPPTMVREKILMDVRVHLATTKKLPAALPIILRSTLPTLYTVVVRFQT